jgi:hypothetical protein
MSREVVADSGADGCGADLSDRQIAFCLLYFVTTTRKESMLPGLE